MIPFFPRWIWSWAVFLPLVAGSVNAAALLSLHHGGVTHLTGISTEGAIGLGSGDVALLLHAVGVIALFTVSCAFSAWLARGPRWIPSVSAGTLLLAVAALLAVASSVMASTPWLGVMICAAAMGLQNGTTSLVTGAVLRTSHLTGMFTDLGIALGQRLWHGPVDRRRVAVCFTVVASFICGATGGTLLYLRWNATALIVSAAVSAGVGILTLALARRHATPVAQGGA
ncbi:YoaK family protein [Luteibacter sp. SG786]|uniref:YoaK family protein n=1 Tax=Luteibacter sp. SG786 TaxID=2587130 RepID=UPI001422E456|nr:YoaK family protein [Luteibacter sp. SG786]NII53983.1 uncharacterized membrane protein YoaK (UPF0700 family) [Luteibacter sp. SG786]